MTKTSDTPVSRRAVVRGAAILAGGGAFVAKAFAQGAKAPQSAAQYQATPKGKARCDSCVAFVGPSSCKVVAGTISPSGWCLMYAAKS